MEKAARYIVRMGKKGRYVVTEAPSHWPHGDVSGFATKAERAGWLKHALLFAGRHKKEVSLFLFFFIVFNFLIVGFFLRLTKERDHALKSEAAAHESERDGRHHDRR